MSPAKRPAPAPRKSRSAPVPQHVRRRLTEDAVLASAERRFVDKGYHRTSIDDIARDAGVTKGAVYFHFSDKLDVLMALLRRAEDRVLYPILKRLEEPGLDPVAKLVAYVHGWGRAGVEQRNTMFLPILMSFEFLGTGTEIEKRLEMMYGRCYDVLTNVIEAGRAQGLFNDHAPAREQAAVLVALMDGMLLEWLRRGAKLHGPSIVVATRSLILAGLLTNQASAAHFAHAALDAG